MREEKSKFVLEYNSFYDSLTWYATTQVDKKDPNFMYEFNISSPEALDFYEIAEELSRDNPICKVEFKAENGERQYYVVIHDSLLSKADALNIPSPAGDCLLNAYDLNSPKEYGDWAEWSRKVKSAKWNGPKGKVTVRKMGV